MSLTSVKVSDAVYTIDTVTGEIKQTKPYQSTIYNPKVFAGVAPGFLNLINNIRVTAGMVAIDSLGNQSKTVFTPDSNYELADTIDKVTVTFEPKLKGQNLQYPKNMNLNQVHIQFNSYDFSEVAETKDTYSVLAGNQKIKSDFFTKFVTLQENQVPYNKDTIKIYAPQNIDVSYGANWSDQAKLSIFGNQQTGDTKNLFNYFRSSVQQLGLQTALDFGLDYVTKYVPEFSLTSKELIGLTTGMVINRNELSTFNNINFRRFQYSFNFFARNKSEHDEIQKIINTFKVALHPLGSAAGNVSKSYARSPVLKYPKLWTIIYMVGAKPVKDIPRTKFCALTDVKLDYTPNSTLTVVGNSYSDIPAINMELSFLELTPLTGDQILNPDTLKYPGDKIGGIDENAVTNDGGSF